MNTPTLSDYEESKAPWNEKEPKYQTYFVTANISMPYGVLVTKDMSFKDIKNKIYYEMKDELKGWDIEDLEIEND